jgi:predicted GNAT family acetyltransferase
MNEATVTNNAAQRCYELRDGDEIAGRLHYEDRGAVRVFTHTKVPPQHEGKGYGSRLANAALEDMRRQGRKLVAQCSFLDAYIGRHPEYEDLRA